MHAGHIENKLGWNGSSTGCMYYDDVRVPAENLIGEEDVGAIYLDEISEREVMCFGPMCLGACEGVFQKALDYVKQRKQDGNTLYLSHQVVRQTLAKMWIATEQLRGFTCTTLDMKDKGASTHALLDPISWMVTQQAGDADGRRWRELGRLRQPRLLPACNLYIGRAAPR